VTQSPWGPAQRDMDAALAPEPHTIADVVRQLDAIQRALDLIPDLYHENPIADFNNLYLTITRRILEREAAGHFNDPAFLNRLDVEFALRYLDALRLFGSGVTTVPAAWIVLFGRYNDASLRSLPCAVAGVNAHINFDLAFALVATWQKLGHAADHSAQHRDYLVVNEVFAEEIPALRRRFLTRWQRCVDRVNGNFDDWYQNMLVECTRARAWERAQQLWLVRDDLVAFNTTRSEMDVEAAAVGRVLLSPFGRLIQ
jgi:hypothetical protein